MNEITISEVPTARGVHASSVGRGVARALFAVADEPRTAEGWIHLCVTAADEAEAAAAELPDPNVGEGHKMLIGFLNDDREPDEPEYVATTGRRTQAMLDAGAAAFSACMPKITGRRNAQAYIACVAVGLQRRYFTGADAKAMLYTVQLALSAHPSRRARRGRKAQS